jgi:phage baseplate assembly protein W
MAPLYGSIIWELLFEPMTVEIQDLIFEDAKNIVNQDPRWKLKEAQITSSEITQQIFLDLLLTYVPSTTEETLRVAFDLNTKRNNP